MLKWLVAAMGVALALVGGYTAATGWSIVQVERGWSQVIAGSVLLTGGFVVLALAGVMARIDALVRNSTAARPVRAKVSTPPKAVAAAPDEASADSTPAPALTPEPFWPPEPASSPLSAPTQSESPAALHKPLLEPEELPAPPREDDFLAELASRSPPPRSAPERPSRPIPPLPPLKSRIPRPGPREPVILADEPPHAPRIPPRVTDFRSAAWPVFPEELMAARPIRVALPPEPVTGLAIEAPPPTLVRRYESGGVSYQLFSDGSIEAQTEGGLYRFSSLSELRAFIETKKL